MYEHACDIAVVGHGAAGLAAALAAVEAAPGARIAVLERTDEADAGGGSRWMAWHCATI